MRRPHNETKLVDVKTAFPAVNADDLFRISDQKLGSLRLFGRGFNFSNKSSVSLTEDQAAQPILLTILFRSIDSLYERVVWDLE